MRICAVVVTFNRTGPLVRSITAMLAQTRPPEAVLVLDNSDEAQARANAAGLAGLAGVRHLRCSRNLGGAGGFYQGARMALAAGYDAVWLMDDDAWAEPGALAALAEGLDGPEAPPWACSRVLWTDGTDHPMNLPWPWNGTPVSPVDRPMDLRACSFVSCLVRADAMRELGLPNPAFFIWSDDQEYTARLATLKPGRVIPGSVVVHETASKGDAGVRSAERLRYSVRNRVWLALYGAGWPLRRRLGFLKGVARDVLRLSLQLRSPMILLRGLGYLAEGLAPLPRALPQ